MNGEASARSCICHVAVADLGEINEFEIGVISNAVTFIQNFVEIGQLVELLKGWTRTRRHHGDFMHQIFSLRKRVD
jgi:hypothetical protein